MIDEISITFYNNKRQTFSCCLIFDAVAEKSLGTGRFWLRTFVTAQF